MKRFPKLLMTSALGVIGLSGSLSAAETMVYDLRLRENFDFENQISVGKDEGAVIWQWGSYLGSGYDYSGPEMYNSNEYPTDGYYSHVYYTPDLSLQPGTYKIYTTPRKKSTDFVVKAEATLRLLLAQGEVTESAIDNNRFQQLAYYTAIPYSSMSSADAINNLTAQVCEFTVTEAGNYKVCFYGKGAGLTLHNTYIVKADGGSVTPDPGTDPEPDPEVTVVPGEVNSLAATVDGQNVTISFILPFEGTKGESLEGSDLKYVIYRDGTQISAKSRQTAGSSVSYTDSDLDYGTYEYGVEVSLGDEVGARASVKAEVKKPVVAPSEKVDLPVSENFAGAEWGSVWYAEEPDGQVAWTVEGDLTSQLPPMKVYDGDGGMAVWRGWDAKNGDSARMVTVPITASSSTAPVIDFMFGHSYSRACTNYIQLQVSRDGGEWQNVEGARIVTYIPELDNGGWTYYKYSLAPYIEGCATYQVGILAVAENLNVNVPIDAINIYNALAKDVVIESIDLANDVKAGTDLEIAITLENRGSSNIQPADYTVNVESNLPSEISIDKPVLTAYGKATVTAKAPVTAEEVLDGPEYSFKVSVNIPGNEGSETLNGEELKATVSFVDHKSPANAAAMFQGSTFSGLSWESVKDLNHEDININENFNDLPAHHQESREVNGKTENVFVDGQKGNFNGWISLDFDKLDGGTYYSTSGSEFQVFKDFMTGSMPQGHSGQYIGLTLPANMQQDDWLISPAISASETSVINFSARIAYISRQSDSYNNSLEVLYATDDYDENNPAAAFTNVLYSQTSKATSGDVPHDGLYHWLRVNGIPAKAKYVAIHFNTKSGMQTGVWVDRLSLTENDLYPLSGYYVYRRNSGRLNESPLSATELSYALQGAQLSAENPYYVTALYGDGESRPSNMVGDTSGVNTVLAETSVNILAVSGGVMVSGLTEGTINVYTLDGRCVASVKSDGLSVINLEPGIYAVKAGSASAKIIVK